MELRKRFKGKSGKLYLLNPFGGEKYTYTIWNSLTDQSISQWGGSATLEEAQADSDEILSDNREVMIINTPNGEKKYKVDDLGLTDTDEKITDILKIAYEQFGRENVNLIRNVLQ